MSTTYNFMCFYRKSGVAYNPILPVTVSVGDGINTLSSNSVTTLTTIVGERRFSYIGADNLSLSALFHTDDVLCDNQDMFSLPSYPQINNADIITILSLLQDTTFGLSALNDTITTGFASLSPSIVNTGASNDYYIGNLVTVNIIFKDSNGVLVDPTIVTLDVKNPSGIEVMYTYGTDIGLVKDSVGNYHYDINADVSGLWTYLFQGTGVGQSSNGGSFMVIDPFAVQTQVPLY